MSEHQDHETRISHLEAEVERLTILVRRERGDMEAARALARGVDQDVDEIRENLRDFQIETANSLKQIAESIQVLIDRDNRQE